MNFVHKDVWMSLIGYQAMPSASEIAESLEANGFEAKVDSLVTNDDGNWESFNLLGTENAVLQVRRFAATDADLPPRRCLDFLAPHVLNEAICEEREQVEEMLADARSIVQTIKMSDENDSEAELEFGFHCSLGFPPNPDEGVSMWLLLNEGLVGFANEGDILLRFECDAYTKWSEQQGIGV